MILVPDDMPNLEISRILNEIAEQLASCESPAEGRFWAAAREAGLGLETQWPVLGFRLDFAKPCLQLGIEIDGHNYHKTQEQRAADARRDRKLFRAGWHVVRFTAAEVWRDAEACAREVAAMIEERQGEAVA